MNTDTALFRTFIAVAEVSSFGQAAEALHLDPSTVSRHIAQLEGRLGVNLFERTTRQVWLTEAGSLLLGPARAAVQAADQFNRAAASLDRQQRGEVAIGFQTHTVNGEILGWINAAQEQTGGAQVRLEEGNFTDPSAGLRDRLVDLAFVYVPFSDAGLELQPLFTLPWLMFLPSAHPMAAQRRVKLTDLFDEPWIRPATDDPVFVDYWMATDLRAGVEAPPGPAYPTPESALALIATGSAIGVGASARRAMPLEGVVARPVADDRRVTVALAWRRDGLTAATEALRDCLLARFTTPGAPLSPPG